MTRAQSGRELLVTTHAAPVRLPLGLGQLDLLRVAVGDLELLVSVGQQHLFKLGVVFDVALLRALLDLVERRLSDVDEAGVNQRLHLAEQQSQDQGADVGAVNVGVGHQNNLVITGVFEVKLARDAGSNCGDQSLNFGVLEHLVDPCLLDVEDLAAQRQHGLRVAIAALFCRATGGVTLDYEDFSKRRILDRTVGQLAW